MPSSRQHSYQLFGVGALAHRGLPLHRGLVRGSFPAPHHHDPNEMLPNFAFWVMVAAPSCRFSRYRRQWTARSSSSRSHRALEATPQPSCTFLFVILLRLATPALRLGVLADSWQRSESYLFLCRYGRRFGQPSSSSLARRACVHVLPFSSPGISQKSIRVLVFLEFAYWDTLKFARAPGLSGGRGEMAMAVASSARLAFLRGAVCACCMPYTRCFPFLVPVQRWSNELPATTVGERRRRRSL